MEKLESASIEKEKVCYFVFFSKTIFCWTSTFLPLCPFQADKVIGEMDRNCQLKLEEYKEESRQYLLRIQEEHAALVCADVDL